MIATQLGFLRASRASLTRRLTAVPALCGLALLATAAQADPLTFTLDSSQSYVTLSIPNFVYQGNNINILGENTTNGNPINVAWSASTTTGNTAFVSGTIATDLNFGAGNVTGVQFLSGSNAMAALVSGNYRPNPAAYNVATSGYNNNLPAPSNYGSASHVSLGNAALTTFSNTVYDLGSAVKIPVGGVSPANTFPLDGSWNTSTNTAASTGISNTVFAIEGLSLFLVGQVIKNSVGTLGGITPELPGTALGTFTFTSPTNLQMVVPVNVAFSIPLGGGVFLNGTDTGQYVANATVPEPSTMALAALGFVAVVTVVRRQRRRSA